MKSIIGEKEMPMLWYFLSQIIFQTTVVTKTKQCCTTVMSYHIYKSCKCCLYWNYFPFQLDISESIFCFKYIISGPSLMDSAFDKNNYANLNDLQNIQKMHKSNTITFTLFGHTITAIMGWADYSVIIFCIFIAT
jgi:hypothetical protein